MTILNFVTFDYLSDKLYWWHFCKIDDNDDDIVYKRPFLEDGNNDKDNKNDKNDK